MNNDVFTFTQIAFGSRIAESRKRCGLTRRDVALELKVSEQAVGNWERGRNCPEHTYLAGLSELLCVSLDFLLTGVEPFAVA